MLARQAIGRLALRVATAYDAGADSVRVSATVGWGSDIATSQEQVKTICLRAQAALWTSGFAPRQVTVLVLGPVYDDYGDATTDTYGTALLTASTAARFDWRGVNPDSAWEAYDVVFLRPTYHPHIVGEP
jgi:hypothetical protein